MKLQKEIINQIKKIYDIIKDKCICVYVGGSFCINYLTSYHDIDVFIVCANTSIMTEVFNIIYNDKEILTITHDLKEKFNLNILVTTSFRCVNIWDCGNYIYNYNDNQIIFGEKINFNKNILKHKKEYLYTLKESLEKIYFFENRDKKIIKELYHLLTGVYILQNNSYNFTPEQIENINICHETIEQDKMRILLQYCDDYLNSQEIE